MASRSGLRALTLAIACLLLGTVASAWAGPSPTPSPRQTPVRSLKVIVRTGEDWGAGTDDAVWFSLGPAYEWPLVKDGAPPFQWGHTDTFVLPPRGLHVEDIRSIRLRKGRDGQGGRWLLHGFELWVNGRPLYRKAEIDEWMENGHLEWTAPDYPVQPSR